MRTKRTTAVFTSVLILSLAGCVALLGPMDKVRATTAEDDLFIPSPSVAKRMSLGYNGLVADFYWTRAVQYFGAKRHARATSFPHLYPLLDVTTTLDPQLLVAYQFGSIFLSQQPPEGAGQPDKAIELIERGIRANPQDWELYYNLGFIYYDIAAWHQASQAFERGARIPHSNPALAALAAATAQKAGGPEASRLLWTKLYESSESQVIRDFALQHLVALKIADDLPKLEALVRRFQEQNGRYPTNFAELVAAGWLHGIPVDPMGDPYLLGPEGKVEVQSPEKNPYIGKEFARRSSN